jgi:excisionase family DNA binding protein
MKKTKANADLPAALAIDASLEEFGPFLTHEEVAGLLNIHYNTLYSWYTTGRFPQPMTLGGRLKRWPKKVIREYLIAVATGKDGGA